LIEQARHLASRTPRSPSQADLRRAASAAYYALFHFLIDEACRYLLGSSGKDRALRATLARVFAHGEMAEASKFFRAGKGTLPAGLAPYVVAIPKGLSTIAEVFTDAQGIRHRADYDVGASFLTGDVAVLIDRVEGAISGWDQIRNEPSARLYLLSLLIYERIRKIK